MDVAVIDGQLQPDPDTSAAHLLGLTCFDTIRFDQEALIDGDAHLERFAHSARTLGLGPKGGWEAVDDAIRLALETTEHTTGILRVSLHALSEPIGLQVPDATAQVQVLATAPRYGDLTQGVTAVTSTIQAPNENAWPSHVKAPCLPRYIAHREARGRDAFEGLMLDPEDRVVSGTRSTVIALLDETLATPPSPPAFPGITRARLIDTIDDVQVRPIARDTLNEATELYLAFTGPGLVPVTTLDGAPVGSGKPGERFEPLRERLETAQNRSKP